MRSKSRLNPAAERPATTALPSGRPPDDSWVDGVADEVTELLRERGLDLELLVMHDKVTEVLHAVGISGAPARYFRSLESDRGPKAQAPEVPGSALATEGARSSQTLTSAP